MTPCSHARTLNTLYACVETVLAKDAQVIAAIGNSDVCYTVPRDAVYCTWVYWYTSGFLSS